MQRYKRYFYFPSYSCFLCFYQLRIYFLKNKSIKNLVFLKIIYIFAVLEIT